MLNTSTTVWTREEKNLEGCTSSFILEFVRHICSASCSAKEYHLQVEQRWPGGQIPATLWGKPAP